LWGDTLHRVLQEGGEYIDGGCDASDEYWKRPMIGMMFQDNETMNGHLTVG
jgi:hypothetical protein